MQIEDKPDDKPAPPPDDVKGLRRRGDSADNAVEAVKAVIRSGYIDGMYRRLQAKFPDLPSQDIEDALLRATEKCADLPKAPDNVRSWLYAVARYRLIDVTRTRKPTESFDLDDPAHNVIIAPSAEDEVIAAEQTAKAEESFKRIVAHVETWPSIKARTVVVLVLEAAREGIPLSNNELAEEASRILSEDLTPGAAAVQKSRGLARLRSQYPDILPDHIPGEDE